MDASVKDADGVALRFQQHSEIDVISITTDRPVAHAPILKMLLLLVEVCLMYKHSRAQLGLHSPTN